MSFLEIEGLTRTFPGGVEAVAGIDLACGEGEFVVLLGPSGCGKTTTLRMLAGLETPTSGQIRIAGEPVEGLPPARRDVGFVFQFYALYPHMTVAGNVGFPLECDGVGRGERRERVGALLEQMQLSHLAGRRPGQLGGGDRQRVALARALVRRPRLWLMDEPLGTLDAGMRAEMRELIRERQLASGITTVYVTHDQEEAMSLADRVVVMDAGEICQAGPPAEVYDDPENLFAARFIGSPGMNFAAGEIGGEPPVFTGALDGDGSGRFPVKGGRPGPVTLGVRPEFLRPDPAGPVPAAVVVDELLGRHRNLHLDTPLGRLIMRLGGEAAETPEYRPGERLTVALDRDHLRFFDSNTGCRI